MPSHATLLRPQMHDQTSSSSSLSGMEKPVQSFKDFVGNVALLPDPITPPTHKPLPPTPLIMRRSSSVYSQDLATPNEFRPWSESSATDFFLQPIRYSASSPQLPHTEVVHFLKPKTYSPLAPFSAKIEARDFGVAPSPLSSKVSLISTNDKSRRGSGYSLEPTTSSAASTTSNSRPLEVSEPGTPVTHTQLFSPSWSPRPPHTPKLPPTPASPQSSIISLSVPARQASIDKVRTALGLDLPEVSPSGSQSGNRRVAPPRQRDYAHYIPSARLQPRPHFDEPKPGEGIEEKSQAQLIAEEYHSLLTDRYRHERDEQTKAGSFDIIKKDGKKGTKNGDWGLIPAPLFWKRKGSVEHGKEEKAGLGSGGFRQRLPSLPQIKLPDGLLPLTAQLGRRASLTVTQVQSKAPKTQEDLRPLRHTAEKEGKAMKGDAKAQTRPRDLLPLHTPLLARSSVISSEKRNPNGPDTPHPRPSATATPKLYQDRASEARSPPPLVRLDHQRKMSLKISPPLTNPFLFSGTSTTCSGANKLSIPISSKAEPLAPTTYPHPLRQHKPSINLVTNAPSHLGSSSKSLFDKARDSIPGQMAALLSLQLTQAGKDEKRRLELKKSIRLVGEVEAMAHSKAQYGGVLDGGKEEGVTLRVRGPGDERLAAGEREKVKARDVSRGRSRGRPHERGRGREREKERGGEKGADVEDDVKLERESGREDGGWL